MKLTQRVPPNVFALNSQEVFAHLRLPSAPDDEADILRVAQGCVAELDGPTGKLRRALMTQEWSLWLDCFKPRIKIPLPPCQSVDAIKYIDTNNVWQTLDPSLYRVIDGGNDRSEIVLAPDQSWPSTAFAPACVEIQFTCGWTYEGSPPESTLPRDIKNALMEMVALRYSVRDGLTFSTDRMLDELPAVRALQRWRVYD